MMILLFDWCPQTDFRHGPFVRSGASVQPPMPLIALPVGCRDDRLSVPVAACMAAARRSGGALLVVVCANVAALLLCLYGRCRAGSFAAERLPQCP